MITPRQEENIEQIKAVKEAVAAELLAKTSTKSRIPVEELIVREADAKDDLGLADPVYEHAVSTAHVYEDFIGTEAAPLVVPNGKGIVMYGIAETTPSPSLTALLLWKGKIPLAQEQTETLQMYEYPNGFFVDSHIFTEGDKFRVQLRSSAVQTIKVPMRVLICERAGEEVAAVGMVGEELTRIEVR